MYRALRLFLAFALVTLSLAACVADPDDAPSEDEMEEMDNWVVASQGKADLPSSWTDLVAFLRDFYKNRMSAVWHDQEHPATPAAAMARIRTLMQQSGVADPTKAFYPTTVQRLRTEYIDHSEINIVLAPGKVLRLVGDPKGSGAFFDSKLFETTVGTKLCLTWAELQTAVDAAYLDGVYAAAFVCHNVTERVLRALDAGTDSYAKQIRTYQAARWMWGPLLPSGNSQNPATWAVSRACPR